jgi:arabinose-5-phosphate isomerase
MTKLNYIKTAKKASSIQISELRKVNKIFNKNFVKAIDLIANCKGKIIAVGIGKSGLIARKFSATCSSVGFPSFYLNPSEANHGDLGQIDRRGDLIVCFSYSGNTVELTNMLKYANRFNIKIIGVSSKKDSLLLKASDIQILLPKVKESDPTGMVPTTSTSITLLFCDCLCAALMEKSKFSKERFKIFHPGGSIGQQLLLTKDLMLKGNKLPLINYKSNILKAIQIINKKKLGLGIIVKNSLTVVGIVTDGDIRRGTKKFSKKDKINTLMTKKPLYINESSSAHKGLSIMSNNLITSLLVSSDSDYKKNKIYFKVKGLLHLHTLLKYGIK